ncbi:MAG: hypothetical protein WD114_00490 [Phycisphaerales bacterium]
MLGLPEISVSAAGFRLPRDRSPREVIDAIAALGVRGLALDAAAPGTRPRELGRSGRRDLAASLRRRELELTGLELWIPAEHFTDPAHAQRAVDAVIQALEMAGEMAPLVGGRSRAVVSVLLPTDLEPEARLILGDSAQRVGATLADHRLIVDDDDPRTPGIGIGIDPVFCLMDGRSPGKAVIQAGSDLASARLSDASAMGRCPVGAKGGKLDLPAYAGALIVSEQAWVTLDLRDMHDPIKAAELARAAWRDAGTI